MVWIGQWGSECDFTGAKKVFGKEPLSPRKRPGSEL
jgi:hypothetical protein